MAEHSEYAEVFVDYLALLWGEGFMSPGGNEEVARIVTGLGVEGKRVLDIGCGVGGPTCFLVSDLKAAHAVGIDVEAALVERAQARAGRHGLAHRVEFRVTDPGRLPFEDAAFDLVFSKDSIVHIPDKSGLLAEAYRVLAPGGWIAIGDWLRGVQAFSPEMTTWLCDLGLGLEMWTPAEMEAALAAAGFVDVAIDDRNAWYRDGARKELERMEGAEKERLVAVLGRDGATDAISRLRLKATAVEQGHLRPSHLRGRKPEA